MDAIPFVTIIQLVNLFTLGVLSFYLFTKVTRHPSVPLLLGALVPLITFETGSYFFTQSPGSSYGAVLIVLGIALIPLGFTPLSHTLGRDTQTKLNAAWLAYYSLQLLLLVFFIKEIVSGQLVEWVTGILDQPIILIEKKRRFLFLSILVSSGVALLCFENTVRNAGKSQLDTLKFVFIAFLGFMIYFCYVSSHILQSSYISQSTLLSGSAIIFLGLLLLSYSLAKYPFWQIKIVVSRRIVFGCLSITALVVYLIISGTIIDLLNLIQPHGYKVLFPVIVFALAVLFLIIYLSPSAIKRTQSFITHNFFRNKYDYRDLWMKFSEKSSGYLNLTDLLPRVAEFIADAMFVRQVAIWLRSPDSDTFTLAYCHEPISSCAPETTVLHCNRKRMTNDSNSSLIIPDKDDGNAVGFLPMGNIQTARRLGVKRVVPVQKGEDVLALLGIGADIGDKEPSTEDEQLLSSIGNQLAHLILTQRLSEELLLAREWESFNRFSSFIMHDLKNLATLQSMTLENAKRFSNNPEFLADAFGTFAQTTDKMINLIASLSLQRGQFSLQQKPVNIIEVIASTFDNLKIDQRNGLKVVTAFPPKERPPIISGDPELLQKAFTNLLLNAIQSLPKGKGAVEVTVSEPNNGKITTAIKDTGCGIPPEQLENLFRPFQTTKRRGMGIGLCHTRSIVEVHGGHMRVESRVDAGTKVELEFPTLRTNR